jgi:hypothetical protein
MRRVYLLYFSTVNMDRILETKQKQTFLVTPPRQNFVSKSFLFLKQKEKQALKSSFDRPFSAPLQPEAPPRLLCPRPGNPAPGYPVPRPPIIQSERSNEKM